MGSNTAELTDFLDCILAQPLEFRSDDGATNLPSTSGATRHRNGFHNHVQHRGTLQTATADPIQEVLQAQSLTDVLASVATDRNQLSEAHNSWGGSFISGGNWTFEPSLPGGAADGPAGRMTTPTDCSSNNSGDVLPLKQEDLTSPTNERIGSEGDSDLEMQPPTKSNSSSRLKETASGRAEQRRTRKREKDRIEEMQAAVQRGLEEKGQLQAQTDELARHLQEKDEELRKLRAAEESALPAADDDKLAASFEGSLKLTVDEDREILLTPEQLRTLSPDNLRMLWSRYVERLRELLEAGRQPGLPQQIILQRIQALQRELVILHIRSAIVNVSAIKTVSAALQADQQLAGGPREGSWGEVAEGLHLTPSQKGLMTELWQKFNGRIKNLMSVRDSIHQHLAATMPDGVFGRSFAVNFLKAHELMDSLKYNLRQEHIVLCDFAATFHKILTPLQNAGCIVSSWPFWPDMPQIARSVAVSMRGC